LNESQRRIKNEEIIAKVTNWSTGEQHLSLRSPQHTQRAFWARQA